MQRVWSSYLDEGRGQGGDTTVGHNKNYSDGSQAASTRQMLQEPSVPFASPYRNSTGNESSTNVSLTVNYLPTKFSSGMLSPGPRKRKGKGGLDIGVPKRGGGVDAFRSGANRIPGQNDEDEDGSGWFGDKRSKKRMKWTRFKWILFVANTLLSAYSLTALIFCLLTWFNVWTHADVVRVGNRPELITSTIAASLGIVTSVIGWAGILLNNRAFLAVYAFLLWFVFAFLLIPGYITYRRRTFNLEGKINAQWSRELGTDGRLRIQNQLGCCGYFSPFVEATISATCYARSVLPGCKLGYMQFERLVLGRWFTVAFALVPVHLFVMISALLCSNHVTYRFGKGMMPKAYRLSMGSMAVIMDNYAQQLAEQYGADVASDIINRSRSNLHLDKTNSYSSSSLNASVPMVNMPYATSAKSGYSHTKYDSVGKGGRPAPEGAN